MSASLERRYRRVLRLLPAGYRAAWEEDMVSSFLDSGADRVPWGERLSVLALAIRLRTTGAYASPQVLVWHRAAQSLALSVLMFVAAAQTTSWIAWADRTMRGPGRDAPSVSWTDASGIIWCAVFGCLVFGRNTAARLLAVAAVMATYAGAVVWYLRLPGDGGTSIAPASAVAWLGWPIAVALLVLLAPRAVPPSRRFWSSTYVAITVVLLPDALPYLLPYAPPHTYVGTGVILQAIIVVVAGFALASARRAPHRPLALAAAITVWTITAAGSTHGAQVLGALVLLALAGVCAAVGLAEIRRAGTG
jgi:hypothetical protein